MAITSTASCISVLVLPREAPATLPIFGCADYLENLLTPADRHPEVAGITPLGAEQLEQGDMITNHVASAMNGAAINIRIVFRRCRRSKPTLRIIILRWRKAPQGVFAHASGFAIIRAGS